MTMNARTWILGLALTAVVAIVLLRLPSGHDGKPLSQSSKPKLASLPPPASPLESLSPGGALAEADRRALYVEVMSAEALAAREAERAFPDLDPMMRGFSEDRFKKQRNKRRVAQEALGTKYRQQIAARQGLTKDQLDQIAAEGRAKGWPAS
jgi:hypothetical protein